MQNQDMGISSRPAKYDVRPDVTPCTAAAHQRVKELFNNSDSIQRTAQSECGTFESYIGGPLRNPDQVRFEVSEMQHRVFV
jgi:hypothetical protein